jgi:hypothetical protein
VPRLLLTLLVAPLVGLGLPALTPVASTAAPTTTAAEPAATHPEWGATSAESAKLRRGCHDYAYSYTLTPPDGDWSLETFLVGPRGKAAGSGYFLTGKDPLTGTSSWRLCRHGTKGGVYTIKAKLSVQNGGDVVEGWLPPSTFKLRKPR